MSSLVGSPDFRTGWERDCEANAALALSYAGLIGGAH
jgi:hypothetical protein